MQGQSSVGQFERSWSLLPESRRLCRGKIAGKEEDRRQQCQILTDKLEGLCTIHFERANRLVKYWGQRLLPADDEPGCFGWGVRVCTVRAMQECGGRCRQGRALFGGRLQPGKGVHGEGIRRGVGPTWSTS